MSDISVINKAECVSSEAFLKLENVTKKFGNFVAVNKFNLEVCKGETIGLVGPNGAGKTTLIKMIAMLLRPNSGRVLIRNNSGNLQDLNKNSHNLIKRGFLIDVPFFYNMTAYQLLKYFAQIQHFPKEKTDKRIKELLEQFHLSEWIYKKVSTFSKGMTQKIGIIQSIIHDPEIIILDEPQSGLDPTARIEIRQFIRDLQKEGKTIFMSSHLLYEVSEVCDKVALINHGNLIAFDTIENLEKILKTKEVDCEIADQIAPEKLSALIDKLIKTLDPYLDKALDPNVSKIPVLYTPQNKAFKFFYNDKKESIGQILKILIKVFEPDFTITSYTQPKTSKLEKIYSQMISEDDAEVKLTNQKNNHK